MNEIPRKDLELSKGMLAIIEQRRDQYGSVLVSSVITKVQESWYNSLTRIEPQYKTTKKEPAIIHDYGNVIAAKIWLDVDGLLELIEHLWSGQIAVKGLSIIDFKGSFDIRIHEILHLSNDSTFQLEWPAKIYQLKSDNEFQGRFPVYPLVSLEAPLFPGSSELLSNWCTLDISRYSQYSNSFFFVLPNYMCRIVEAVLRSDHLWLKIETLEIELKDIIGKAYFSNYSTKDVAQIEFSFEENFTTIPLEFVPDWLNLVLLSKESGETLDSRRMHISWPSGDSGVDVKLYSDDIEELILRGENEYVEFKAKMGDNNKEVAETLVAFSNTRGGTILFGVNDNGEVVGEYQRDVEQRIMDLVTNTIEPSISLAVRWEEIDEKPICLVQVEEGENKPYNYRNRGVYVRRGSTDRIASRYELDAFYEKDRIQRSMSLV